jgi:hypothetical protein
MRVAEREQDGRNCQHRSEFSADDFLPFVTRREESPELVFLICFRTDRSEQLDVVRRMDPGRSPVPSLNKSEIVNEIWAFKKGDCGPSALLLLIWRQSLGLTPAWAMSSRSSVNHPAAVN